MLIFGLYLVIVSVIDYKAARVSQRKASDNEFAEISNLPNSKHFPMIKYMISQFLMEIGDKCQIGAITMSIAYNVWQVAIGSIIGIYACTILAVCIGNLLQKRINEHIIGAICGAAFIIFALIL